MRRCSTLAITMILLVSLLPPLAGCQGRYDGAYRFQPRPIEAVARVPGHEGSVRVLATIIGVVRPDAAAGVPASVETRLRVENRSTAEAVLDPASLELVASNLEAFPAPRAEPDPRLGDGAVLRVPPQATGVLSALFPFPGDRYPGVFDLAGLNLGWTLEMDGLAVPQSVTFTRVIRQHRAYSVGYGYGWYGHGAWGRYGWHGW